MNVTVINLAARTDRREAFAARWHAAGIGLPLHAVQVFAAVRGRDPVAGCLASHHDVLAAGGDRPLLVLEDDAAFAPGFALAWPNTPPGWQLLRLGGQYRGVVVPVTPGWLHVEQVRHTHAYVARHPAALAAWLRRVKAADISAALAMFRPGQYAQWPPTVGQAGGLRSDITGATRPADQFWQ